jgi:hypothetical protein
VRAVPEFRDLDRRFELEALMPIQWRAMHKTVGLGGPEQALRVAVLDNMLNDLLRAVGHGMPEQVFCVNALAWIEDMDGERAVAAGCPWPYTFRYIVETTLPDITAEGLARALRLCLARVQHPEAA